MKYNHIFISHLIYILLRAFHILRMIMNIIVIWP